MSKRGLVDGCVSESYNKYSKLNRTDLTAILWLNFRMWRKLPTRQERTDLAETLRNLPTFTERGCNNELRVNVGDILYTIYWMIAKLNSRSIGLYRCQSFHIFLQLASNCRVCGFGASCV